MKLNLTENPFNKNGWETIETDDLLASLAERFEQFPTNARIYANYISHATDVTPKNEKEIEDLAKMDAEFYVVVWPAYGLGLIAMWVVVAVTAAFSIFTYLNMPKPKASAPTSSNNELASRQNNARINGRIPDIFGHLRATPDLISTPYTTYDANGREIENCLMVLGRGYYQIHDCRESETDVEGIAGTSVSIYDPYESIIGTPIYKTGIDFTDRPKSVRKSSAINGQTLVTPNDKALESTALYFEYPNLIKSRDGVDFSAYFEGGESIEVVGAVYGSPDVSFSGAAIVTADYKVIIETTLDINDFAAYEGLRLTGALVEVVDAGIDVYKDLSGQYDVDVTIRETIATGFKYTFTLANATITNPNWVFVLNDENTNAGFLLNQNANTINLDDSYSISAIGTTFIELANPELINPDWLKLQSQSTKSQTADITLNKITNKWVGWNSIIMHDATNLALNIYFINGLFRQDSKGGTSYAYLTIEVEYQQIDDNNTPFGQVYKYEQYFENRRREAYGVTIDIPLQFTGSLRFRACKTKVRQAPNVQADVKLKDVFLMAESPTLTYGNVTVVRSQTLGTDGAMSLKERKLNCLVTRKLNYNGLGALTPTVSADQALIALALDPYIGRRSQYEIDVDNINDEIQKSILYFGSSIPSEFSYTFDDDGMSFEEQAGIIASAVFCEAYRFGNKLRIKFEKPQDSSVLLFNHRNKLPLTETRTRNFGILNEYDGVELEYTSPLDDARINYFVGSGTSDSTNPLKVNTSGVRNHAQAKIRAHREWNKLQYHRVNCEFTATAESNLLARNDRILVSDDTRINVQDGEILLQNGLTLVTSQPVIFDATPHYIHLQMATGGVDYILCTAGNSEYEVILSRAPSVPIITDDDMKVKTLYKVVKSTATKSDVFLVSTIEKSDDNSNVIKAINYSDRYYENDHDFI